MVRHETSIYMRNQRFGKPDEGIWKLVAVKESAVILV